MSESIKTPSIEPEAATDLRVSVDLNDKSHSVSEMTSDIPKNSPSETPTLSKNALKRIQKQQKWEETKASLKLKRKVTKKQRKLRKQELKAQGISVPSQPRRNPNSTPSGIKLIIDCQFDEKMSDKEIKSLCKQLELSYSANRRSNKSVDLVCTSVSEKLEEHLSIQVSGYKQWKMEFTGNHYIPSEDTSKMVYLTADSENTLETLEPGATYIIGGLVDHNHYKNECLNKAKREGLRHAKLPISEYINMQCRKVLTVNHCVEILLNYLDTSDWKTAFLSCIPQRKVENKVDINSKISVVEGHSTESSIIKKRESQEQTDITCEKRLKLDEFSRSCE